MSRPLRARAEQHAVAHARQPGLRPQLAPALGEEVADEAEVLGEELGVQLRDVPAREVGVDAVHERGVVAHLRRQRAEQVPDPLLVLDVHVEVADQARSPPSARMLSRPRLNSPDSM